MERFVAGRASSVKLFCQNIIMRCDNESIPDRSRPGLPTTGSGVARQGICRNYAAAGLSEKKKEKGKRKASEEIAGTVEGEMHTHNVWYFKYSNNDWNGERAGRHDKAQKCRHTVPTENIVEKE